MEFAAAVNRDEDSMGSFSYSAPTILWKKLTWSLYSIDKIMINAILFLKLTVESELMLCFLDSHHLCSCPDSAMY